MSVQQMTAELFVDPICPWAWMTSRWALQVESVRPVHFRFEQMCLSALNEGRDLPPDYRKVMDAAWYPARVLAAAIEEHGQQVTRPLYEAIGERIHPGGSSDYRVVAAEALAQLGLPPALLEVGDRTDLDDLLRGKRDRVIELVGDDVGTPTICCDGEAGPAAFFGPVVTPAPVGEQAGRLWDGCMLVAGTPGFYELKRSRTAGPNFALTTG